MKNDDTVCSMCEDDILAFPNYKLVSRNWLYRLWCRLWNRLASPNYALKKYFRDEYGGYGRQDLTICNKCTAEIYENILARRIIEEAGLETLKRSQT